MQTVKRLFKQSASPFLTLLSYRAMPLPWCNLSPAELLLGRRLRTTVPQTDRQLIPRCTFLLNFKRLNRKFKDHQKEDFDRRHRVQELPPIPDDKNVWVFTEGELSLALLYLQLQNRDPTSLILLRENYIGIASISVSYQRL